MFHFIYCFSMFIMSLNKILKKNTMIKDIVNILKDISLRHKGVRTFKYQGDDHFNAQNNNAMYQVYCDDVSLHELNITNNVFKCRFELYIMGFVDDEHDILEVQNNAYTIAADIVAYIDTQDAFKGVLSVYDYSLLTFSHFTDDNASGVKLSLVLDVPSPVDLCTLEDNFNEEPYSGDTDTEITISGDTISDDLLINPIKLPKNRIC